MSYIRQGQLFSWEGFVENGDDNTRLVLVLDALGDEKLLQWLRGWRKADRTISCFRTVLWLLATIVVLRSGAGVGARFMWSTSSEAEVLASLLVSWSALAACIGLCFVAAAFLSLTTQLTSKLK